jgi:prepilin-type N-terminal cleavage/methylation domain-containing protein
MNKNAGFTIIEIVVVLILMSIIAAFAIGRGRVTSADLKVQTEVLKSRLRYAQARAINDNVHWGIQTDNSGGRYWLFRYDAAAATPLAKINLPGEQANTVNLAAQSITMSPGTYVFDDRGIPYFALYSATPPGAKITANQNVILSKGADHYTITITKNTGFIE